MISRILLLLILSTQLFISCDAEFSPYGDFKDKYILSCILRSDTTFQTAVLSHNYLPENPDPVSYTYDPSISGADIRVWYDDNVYVFKDSSEARSDTSRYKGLFRFYYNNEFSIRPGKEIEIEVLLQNGKRLRANSVTPGEIRFQNTSDVLIPPVGSNLVQFNWEAQNQGTYFSPKFEIKYKQIISGDVVLKSIQVPLRYTDKDGEMKPVYPNYSFRTNIQYSLDVISQTLNLISEGDPDKQNYYIYQTPVFNLLAFDDALSRYASSTSSSLNEFTVIINAADYTNIENGFGIFGSSIKKNYSSIKFQQSYIQLFGYNFIFDGN